MQTLCIMHSINVVGESSQTRDLVSIKIEKLSVLAWQGEKIPYVTVECSGGRRGGGVFEESRVFL